MLAKFFLQKSGIYHLMGKRMSHLSVKLKEILADNMKAGKPPKTASELSRASGIPNSNLSRILLGAQKLISREDFTQLVAAISKDARVQAEIVEAHMLDSCFGPGSDLIKVSIIGAKAPKVASTRRFSRNGEAALDYLRTLSPGNPTIEQHLITTAKLLGMDLK